MEKYHLILHIRMFSCKGRMLQQFLRVLGSICNKGYVSSYQALK